MDCTTAQGKFQLRAVFVERPDRDRDEGKNDESVVSDVTIPVGRDPESGTSGHEVDTTGSVAVPDAPRTADVPEGVKPRTEDTKETEQKSTVTHKPDSTSPPPEEPGPSSQDTSAAPDDEPYYGSTINVPRNTHPEKLSGKGNPFSHLILSVHAMRDVKTGPPLLMSFEFRLFAEDNPEEAFLYRIEHEIFPSMIMHRWYYWATE